MRIIWRRMAPLMVVLLATSSGCRRAVVADTEPDGSRLGTSTELDAADWLKLSRRELATRVEKAHDTAVHQRQEMRDTKENVRLLPYLLPPVALPVFHAAKFDAGVGVSLPAYAKSGDADIALHLARFGDRDGALRVADPADKELSRQIDAVRTERSYPVEWTQLVAIHLHLAELKVANGNLEGATELVLLHKQLLDILDSKAAAGPLGATLLPIGRRALADGARAWDNPENGERKPKLAEDIESALAEWGTVPTLAPLVPLGAQGESVARVLHATVEGRTVIARSGESVARAVDLLDLSLVGDGVQHVLAFLDADGKLVEWLILYKEGVLNDYPGPVNLAHLLVDLGYHASAETKEHSLPQQAFSGGGLLYEVTAVKRGRAFGAFVRIGAEKAPPALSTLGSVRDFGALHLDRSFARNCRDLAPTAAADAKVQITKASALKEIRTPITEPVPSVALLERASDLDLLSSFTLVWANEQDLSGFAATNLALPLWARYGPARITSVDDAERPYLALVWESKTTRVTLRLPFDAGRPAELVASDARGPEALKERVAVAAAKEAQERTARWNADQPEQRLERKAPGQGLEMLALGKTKKEAHAILSVAPEARLTALPDGGYNLLTFTAPPAGLTFWPRQVFVRFDHDDRIAEIRVRYQEVAPTQKDRLTLFDTLKKTNGAPEKIAATWTGVWADLGLTSLPTHFRWLDDQTALTFQRDGGGPEVIVRDCKKDSPLGVDLGPLSFCSRGVDGCHLGDTRTEVLKRFKQERPQMAGEAVVLPPPSGSPYDALLVYFTEGADGKATRIVGQYTNVLRRPDAAQAIMETWRANLDQLGAVRRQETPPPPALQSSCWHDDRTRVRIFGQQTTETGPRLYCEWRELPIVPVKTAAR